ncbi:putative reverse transcriptase domain-containing protein [Tanacetum coccineum]
MRQMRWLELFSDYECEIKYHPVTIPVRIKGLILEAQGEAFKDENMIAEGLNGTDQQMEKREDGSLHYMDRIWAPLVGGVRTKIMDECHKRRLTKSAHSWQYGRINSIGEVSMLYMPMRCSRHGVQTSIISYKWTFYVKVLQTFAKAWEQRLDMSTAYRLQTMTNLDRSIDSDKYLEGQSMQRPPLFERDSFIYWKNRFETYVKSKDLDLWHIITDDDFKPIVQNPETKLDEVVPFDKQRVQQPMTPVTLSTSEYVSHIGSRLPPAQPSTHGVVEPANRTVGLEVSSSSLSADKLFKLFHDFDTLAPKLEPQNYKAINLLEGGGGVGSIKSTTYGDGDALLGILDSSTHHIKFVPSADGGAVFKDNVELDAASFKDFRCQEWQIGVDLKGLDTSSDSAPALRLLGYAGIKMSFGFIFKS